MFAVFFKKRKPINYFIFLKMDPKCVKFSAVNVTNKTLCNNMTVTGSFIPAIIKSDAFESGNTTLTAPAGQAYTLTLPPDGGTAGQYLSTNGSGVLNWSTLVPSFNADSLPNTANREWLLTGNQTVTGIKTFENSVEHDNMYLTAPITGNVNLTGNWNFLNNNPLDVRLIKNSTREVQLGTSPGIVYIDINPTPSVADYDVRILSNGGTPSNGTGALNFYTSNMYWVTPTGNELGWKIQDVDVTATASQISRLNVSTTGTIESTKAVTFSGTVSVSSFGTLNVNTVKFDNEKYLGTTSWSSGLVSTDVAATVFLADTTSAACTLTLGAPVAGRLLYVHRNDSGTTNPLIISPGVYTLNGTNSDITTTLPHQSYRLFSTASAWFIK